MWWKRALTQTVVLGVLLFGASLGLIWWITGHAASPRHAAVASERLGNAVGFLFLAGTGLIWVAASRTNRTGSSRRGWRGQGR